MTVWLEQERAGRSLAFHDLVQFDLFRDRGPEKTRSACRCGGQPSAGRARDSRQGAGATLSDRLHNLLQFTGDFFRIAARSERDRSADAEGDRARGALGTAGKVPALHSQIVSAGKMPALHPQIVSVGKVRALHA